MSFNENLQNLRKNRNISQEQLAEKLDVSRQAISKWESGTGYPEMDKLLKICEIFDCSLDVLMKGKVSEDATHEKKIYDNFYNTFSKFMAFSVGLILSGVTILVILINMMSVFNATEEQMSIVGTVILLSFICISVTIMIILGTKKEQFEKKYPKMPEMYSEDEVEKFNNKYSIAIALGVALILVGVIILVTIYGLKIVDENSSMPAAILLGCVTISVMNFIYFGTQKDKYDIEKYNKRKEIENSLVGRISGVIMMIAVIIFFIMGFVYNLWQFSWIVFPIGGMLCGIVSTICGKEN